MPGMWGVVRGVAANGRGQRSGLVFVRPRRHCPLAFDVCIGRSSLVIRVIIAGGPITWFGFVWRGLRLLPYVMPSICASARLAGLILILGLVGACGGSDDVAPVDDTPESGAESLTDAEYDQLRDRLTEVSEDEAFVECLVDAVGDALDGGTITDDDVTAYTRGEEAEGLVSQLVSDPATVQRCVAETTGNSPIEPEVVEPGTVEPTSPAG